MILYTCQDIKSLKSIEEKGRFINRRKYIKNHFDDISNIFLRCYDWFVEEASKIVPKPRDVEYPIWCSTSVEATFRPTDTEVVYILDIPDEEIILFDGGKWDHVLNLIYLPKDEKDLIKYKEDLKLKGIENQYNIFNSNKSKFYKAEQDKIINSWHRIFDIKDSTNFSLQGNIWEIKKDNILEIVEYGNSIPLKYYIQEKSQSK